MLAVISINKKLPSRAPAVPPAELGARWIIPPAEVEPRPAVPEVDPDPRPIRVDTNYAFL